MVQRTYRGWYIGLGRRRYLKVKWLRPGVTAIRCGHWQFQAGRLLVRCSPTFQAITERRQP